MWLEGKGALNFFKAYSSTVLGNRCLHHLISMSKELTTNYRYPFHLRPKNLQAFQYVHMAGDMVRDMGLDRELPELNSGLNSEVTKEQLEKARTYLSWFYAGSKYVFPLESHIPVGR
jgi:hypothetical protein